MERGKNRHSFWVWFGAIWLTVGAPFLLIGLYVGWSWRQEEKRLEINSRTVTGMVLTREIQRSGGSNRSSTPSYYVSYRFQAGEQVLRSRAEVSVSSWDNLAERGPVPVRYVADQPEISRIPGQEPGWVLPLIFSGLGGFLSVAGGLLLRGGLRRGRAASSLGWEEQG